MKKIITLMVSLGFLPVLFLFTNATFNGSEVSTSKEYATSLSDIPKYALSKNACFLAGEEDAQESALARKTVSGCSKGIVVPSKIVVADTPYAKGAGNIYECARLRDYTFGILREIVAMEEFSDASDAAYGKDLDSPEVLCVTNTIYSWADNNSMGDLNGAVDSAYRQAQFIRAEYIGALAANYVKLPQVKVRAARMGKDLTIQKWFSQRLTDMMADAVSPEYNQGNANLTNRQFWKGFAILALGIATENAKGIAASEDIFRVAMGQINGGEFTSEDRGYMPQELKRGDKAHHYHVYALEPILGMVSLSKSINCGFLYVRDENPLSFLIRKIVEGSQNPDMWTQKVGVEQSSLEKIEGLYSLIGGDEQADRVVTHAYDYLLPRGFKKVTQAPPKIQFLGGNIAFFPAPGSLSVESAEVKKYCH